MPSQTSPNLSLPYVQAAQAQKHVTHNEALRLLDVTVQLTVQSKSLTVPPASPPENARYIVADGATGDWNGHDGEIAVFEGGAFWFITPFTGWQAFVVDENANAIRATTGGWLTSLDQDLQVSRLGINTTPDANNSLTVSGARSLFNHAGNGHQITVTKENASDTAALLFQTGFSGRAEIGIAGNDDLSFKTSTDGSTWTEALRFAGDGSVSGAAVMQSATDTTAGRLMRADFGYSAGNLVGPVSEAAGVPTGAVIETADTAGGSYTRFADGTQICATRMTSQSGAATTWDFPIAFASAPSTCLGTPESSAPRLVSLGAPTITTVSFDCYDLSSARQAETVNLLAIGRWF